METCINYCEPGLAFMSSDERRWINHLRKLSVSRPYECIIIKQPEDNDGFIYVKFPQKWVRVKPPNQVIITDEERARRRENIIKIMCSRASTADDHDDGDQA